MDSLSTTAAEAAVVCLLMAETRWSALDGQERLISALPAVSTGGARSPRVLLNMPPVVRREGPS